MDRRLTRLRRPTGLALACAASMVICIVGLGLVASDRARAQRDTEQVIAEFLDPHLKATARFVQLCDDDPERARAAFRDYVNGHDDIVWLPYSYRLYHTVRNHLGEAEARLVTTKVFLALPAEHIELESWSNLAIGAPQASWPNVYELRLATEDPAKQERLEAMSWGVLPRSVEEVSSVRPTTARGFALRSEGYRMLATVLQRNGDEEGSQECLDEALADAQTALRLDAESIDALYALGRAWSRRGELETALGYFDEVIRRAPEYVLAYRGRAHLHRRMGHETEAGADAAKAKELRAAAKEAAKEAAREAREAWLRSPGGLAQQVARAGALANQTITLRAQGEDDSAQRQGAIDAFTNIFSYHEGVGVYYLRRAIFCHYLGEDDKALQDLDAFLARDPDGTYGYHLRAKLHRKRGNEEAAQADLATYRAQLAARPAVAIELPEFLQSLPTTGLDYFKLRELGEIGDPASVPLIANELTTRPRDALRILRENFDDKALAAAVPQLELVLHRRLHGYVFELQVVKLLAQIALPSSAAVIAEFACGDEVEVDVIADGVVVALTEFSPELAVPNLKYVLINAHYDRARKKAASCLGELTHRSYEEVRVNLIIQGTRREQLAAASLYRRDYLGRLMLLELANDAGTDMAIRQDALAALKKRNDPLAQLVDIQR